MRHKLLGLLLAAVVVAASLSAADRSYEQQLLKWRADRLAELTADDGWLTVVGLYWLHQGENHAGSGRGMDLRLPASAPADLGTFRLDAEHVSFTTAPGIVVSIAGRPVTSMVPIETDKTLLEQGQFQMVVIRRGKRVGLRLRDRESPARRAFKGLEYFPVAPRLRVRARFERFDPPRRIPIINVLGDQSELVNPGRLVFTLAGVEHSLDALLETPDAKDLFVIFRDQTSGDSTYPAGRYMHVPLPVNGETEVDFNRAYNPPCAFTDFATCPLPPKQNWMKVRIDAGELSAKLH
jgi:uncharacterized protein (DUF1684 family)